MEEIVMALLKITKRYKDKTPVTELIHQESTVYNHIPNGETSVEVNVFKYDVGEGMMPPTIVRFTNKTLIMPYNIECHPLTQLSDIKWKRFEVKQNKIESTSESQSGLGKYKTTYNPNNKKYSCNCMGFWRSKGLCKHVKALKLEVEK
jgi:hypothetical protein